MGYRSEQDGKWRVRLKRNSLLALFCVIVLTEDSQNVTV